MKKYFLRQAFFRFLSMMSLCGVVFSIGRRLFPEWSKIIFTEQFWIIYVIVAIYSGYKRYQELLSFSQHLEFIQEVKKERLSSAYMEKYALLSEVFTEINKTKLDILKSFSPIPLIIFILGVYINNTPSIENEVNIFNNKLLISDILIYLGIGIPIFYSYFIYSTFRVYKKCIRKTKDYKAEAIMLKEQAGSKYGNEDKDFA